MKKILLALLLVSAVASAEIYKYVDPVTGAVEYTREPKAGATPALKGEPRTKAALEPDKKRQAAYSDLAKKFPTACKAKGAHAYCDPQPGMPIGLAETAFNLRHVGYTHDATGRIERYSLYRCTVLANSTVITAVNC